MRHKIYSIAVALLAVLALAACSPDDFSGADGNIPQVSDYQAKVEVDQDANTATFYIVDKAGNPAVGVYPVWEINAGSTVKSTVNGFTTAKIAIAGTYDYTMKVGNRNGVSEGEVKGQFTINTTRYDFSDFVAKLTGDGSKEWRVYAAKEFHMGVGPSLTDPASWWHAQPHDKDGTGLYDDRITFTKGESLGSGSYKYSAGEDGQTFLNTDVKVFGADEAADYSMAVVGKAGAQTDAAYALGYDATHDFVTFILPAKTLFPYLGSDSQFNNATTYYVTDISDKTMTVAWEAPAGKWWQLIFVNGADEKQDEQVPVNWCDVNSDLNLGKAFNTAGKMTFFYASGSDWHSIANPEFSFADGVYTIKTSGATEQQWQAQNTIGEVPLSIAAGEFYDVSVKINASESFDKLTWKINKDPDADGDPNSLFAKSNIKLKKGDNIITVTKVTSTNSNDANNPPSFDQAKMIFDLGGCPEGLTLKISDIIVQKHNPK